MLVQAYWLLLSSRLKCNMTQQAHLLLPVLRYHYWHCSCSSCVLSDSMNFIWNLEIHVQPKMHCMHASICQKLGYNQLLQKRAAGIWQILLAEAGWNLWLVALCHLAISNIEQLACRRGHSELIFCSVASINLMPWVNALWLTFLLMLLRIATSDAQQTTGKSLGDVCKWQAKSGLFMCRKQSVKDHALQAQSACL